METLQEISQRLIRSVQTSESITWLHNLHKSQKEVVKAWEALEAIAELTSSEERLQTIRQDAAVVKEVIDAIELRLVEISGGNIRNDRSREV